MALVEGARRLAGGEAAQTERLLGVEMVELNPVIDSGNRTGKLAVWLTLVFAFGWSVLAWDLSMGLSLHFQSALYSWWFFMGGWLCALTLFALLMHWWRSHLDADHLADTTIPHEHAGLIKIAGAALPASGLPDASDRRLLGAWIQIR